MGLGWFGQSMVTNVVWAVLAVAVSGALGYFQMTGSQLLAPSLYALLGLVAVASILTMLRLPALLGARRNDVTVDNVESKIREWTDRFQLGTKRFTTADSIFALQVEVSTKKVLVARPKPPLDHYLLFSHAMNVSPDHRAIYDAMTPQQQRWTVNKTISDASKARVAAKADLPQSVLAVVERMPITSSLTEDSFLKQVDTIVFNSEILRTAFVGALAAAPNAVPASKADDKP